MLQAWILHAAAQEGARAMPRWLAAVAGAPLEERGNSGDTTLPGCRSYLCAEPCPDSRLAGLRVAGRCHSELRGQERGRADGAAPGALRHPPPLPNAALVEVPLHSATQLRSRAVSALRVWFERDVCRLSRQCWRLPRHAEQPAAGLWAPLHSPAWLAACGVGGCGRASRRQRAHEAQSNRRWNHGLLHDADRLLREPRGGPAADGTRPS
jgi:hypothetical protein